MEKIKSFIQNNKKYSTDIVRIALSIVFLWFGISQLIDPGSFLGYLPQWIYTPQQGMMGMMGQTQFAQAPGFSYVLIMLNGLFEAIFGALLLVGFYARISAFLLAAHLFGISFSLGYNDVAVRDFGLALATVSLIFSGAGELSLDAKFRKEKL